MKIYRPKTSNYDSVNTESIIRCIEEYYDMVRRMIGSGGLSRMDRNKLKRIAVDMEDMVKVMYYKYY